MVAVLLVDDWLLLTELAAPFWVIVAVVLVPPVCVAIARLPRPLFWVWLMVMVSLADVLSWVACASLALLVCVTAIVLVAPPWLMPKMLLLPFCVSVVVLLLAL